MKNKFMAFFIIVSLSLCITIIFNLNIFAATKKNPKYNCIVNTNYTGNNGTIVNNVKFYKTIGAALEEAPEDNTADYIIFIKKGTYFEQLKITKPNLKIIGECKKNTIITYNLAQGSLKADGTTYGSVNSPSFIIKAPNIHAENITFENSFDYPTNYNKDNSDPSKITSAQAIALKTDVGSDKSVFINCRFIGYQDTLCANVGRHYFENCYIIGNVDFIYGAGQAVFNKCEVVSRNRKSTTNNGYITAPSTNKNNYGFLFLNCSLKKENIDMADNTVALGRPWHPTTTYPDGTKMANPDAIGNVVYEKCYMDAHITTTGWDKMSGKDKDGNVIWFYPEDSRFYEYQNYGPGAVISESRKVLSEQEISNYTPDKFLGDWIIVDKIKR